MFTATMGRMTLSLADTSSVFAIIAASHAGFAFNTPVPVAPAAPVVVAADGAGGAGGPADTAATLPPLFLPLLPPLPPPAPPPLPPPPGFLST